MRRMYTAVIDAVASFMTAPVFVGAFIGTIIVWIAWNTWAPDAFRYDSAPYMGLNLVMSALAGIQATTVAIAARKADAIHERHRNEIERRHDAHEQRIIEIEARVLQRLDEIESRLLGGVKK